MTVKTAEALTETMMGLNRKPLAVKVAGIFYAQNGVTNKLSNDVECYGASWLWAVAMKEKNERVREALIDIHGLLCATLYGTVEKK
jgi:hypothetical protein